MNLNRFIYLFQGCWAAKVTKKECRSKQNDTHFRALIFVSRSVLGQHQILPFQKNHGFYLSVSSYLVIFAVQ